MTSSWILTVVIAGAVSLLTAGLCFIALRKMERVFVRREADLEEQVETLDDAVRSIEARLGELHAAAEPGGATEGDAYAAAESDRIQGESIDAAIAPEIQAAIAAAAVAVAGPHAQVRSAGLVKPHDDASAWSRQGRVLVQSSHNVRPLR
jgi:hypothetical protein